MIALENMTRVDAKKFQHIPVADWNWEPDVTDGELLDQKFIEASGGNTTSKSTFSSQMDHGENY